MADKGTDPFKAGGSFFTMLIGRGHSGMWLVRIVFAIYILGFSVGTATHWMDIYRNGWKSCAECGLPANLYWLFLAALDPATIVLLLSRPLAGIWMAQAIVITDLAVNVAVGISEFKKYGVWTMEGLYYQVPFAFILFATAPVARKIIFRIRGAEGKPASS